MTQPNRIMLAQPFDLLDRWATRTPHARLFDDGQQTLSYYEVRDYARRIASKLRELGVRPGDIVALELPAGLQVVVLSGLFHEAAASCLHTDAASGFVADWLISASRSESTAKHTIRIDSTFLSELPTPPADFAPRRYDADDLCRIAFSSGTTGTPKPVPLTFEMVHHRSLAAQELWVANRAFISLLDMATASGFHSFYAALRLGDVYLNPGDAAHNLRQIMSHRVASIKASPIQISLLFDEALRHGNTLSSLQTIYSAGSIVPLGLRAAVKGQSTARLFNLYGSTEAGRAAEREIDDDDLQFAGTVVAGTRLEIVDERDQPLPAGATGLVRYHREFQATEYLGDPAATDQAFRDGWFYTGDLGRLDEAGRLTLIGRASDIINAGGIKVNPVDVERFALDLEGIREAAGFAYRTEQGVDEFGLALVHDGAIDMGEVASRLTAAFGPLAPRILFSVPELPRNAMGKVPRAAVAELYRAAVER